MSPTAPIVTCRQILRRSGSSFALAFRVLPAEQRDAMTAFYAFCRQVDDAVDDAPGAEAARAALADWRQRLEALYAGRPTDPVCLALAMAVERFGVRREHLELILDGVEQDLTVSRFARFADLYEYCYRVASAVGLVCVTVLGRVTPEVGLYAELTGIAVQLTNILRDVDEDAARGRIYLPLEDLAAFGLTADDLLAGRAGRKRERLLRFEARRTADFYRMARAALPPELRRQLFFAEVLRETYQQLFFLLERAGFPPGPARVKLGKATKLAIALRHRLHPATFFPADRPGALGRRGTR